MNILDSLIYSNRKAIGFLLLLSGVFFISLGDVHLFDWDEINFAESAREMISSGDYLRVQINFEAFWEKPPFFFWLQVASMKIFGINEFAARFPNAVFGFIYLLSFYLIGKKHFSAKFGMIWALLFFASLLPHVYFKSGIIDPVFNYFIFMSIYFMMRVISGKEDKLMTLALISGVFSGLSVVTKGPVGFLLLGLTLLVYLIAKKFKHFPRLSSILAFIGGLALIIAIWLGIEVYNNGFEILQKFIAYQAELFSKDVAGHAQPFYYHFVVVFFACFPISILALPYLFKRKLKLELDFHTWMLCLFWVVLILFSIVTTKIIHYSSMTYAPLSFVAAWTLHVAMKEKIKLKRSLSITYLVVGLLLGLAILAVPFLFMNKELLIPMMNDPFAVDSLDQNISWSGIELFAGLFFIGGVIVSTILLNRKSYERSIVTIALSLTVTLLFVQLTVLPKIEQITQGPAISFYKELKGQDCYVESVGYKSYAQYYYFEQPYGMSSEQKSMEWLLTGNIDKPVYFVTKSNYLELDKIQDIEFLERKGGFKLYRRIPFD